MSSDEDKGEEVSVAPARERMRSSSVDVGVGVGVGVCVGVGLFAGSKKDSMRRSMSMQVMSVLYGKSSGHSFIIFRDFFFLLVLHTFMSFLFVVFLTSTCSCFCLFFSSSRLLLFFVS